MDPLVGLLQRPRAHGAFVLRSCLQAPWSIRILDEAPLAVVATVRGICCIDTASGQTATLGPGDLAVVRGPRPYVVADDHATAVQVVIRPGQVCTTADGEPTKLMGPLGVRSWGNRIDGSTLLLTGVYETPGEISRPLLAALPDLIVLRGTDRDNPLVHYLAAEADRDEPGQDAVLDRLLDLLLIAALRTWFARADARPPGWYVAHGDPVVGPVLGLLHARPADPWTVASLAAATRTSRAALARRFHELVGEPPMAYLTGWRLSLAADLLTTSDATLDSVARQVGYGSAFALSAAFKRVRGVSPREHRSLAP